MIRVAIHRFTI